MLWCASKSNRCSMLASITSLHLLKAFFTCYAPLRSRTCGRKLRFAPQVAGFRGYNRLILIFYSIIFLITAVERNSLVINLQQCHCAVTSYFEFNSSILLLIASPALTLQIHSSFIQPTVKTTAITSTAAHRSTPHFNFSSFTPNPRHKQCTPHSDTNS